MTRGIDSRSLSTLSHGFTASIHSAREKPDVALVMNVANGYWLPFMKARRVPTVVNVDGIEWERAKWGAAAKATFRLGASMTARYATRLVFDSMAIGTRWKTEFNREGLFIPYGGDECPDLPLEAGLRHRNYVLCIARLVPENTIPEFLEAAVEISERWPVVVVGSSGYGGTLDDALRKLSKSNQKVHWLGHVADDLRLYSLWQHAGVYFHGHSVGGTNPALVQAMAAGAPTIARDTIYNREVLGDAADYVQPNSASIVESVLRLMSDPEGLEQRSQASLQRVGSIYTWSEVCERYHLALSETMAAN